MRRPRIEPGLLMRRDAATTAVGVAGAALGALVTLALGLVLYHRLFGDSVTALALITIPFVAAGIYAGWLLGMVVSSALRGQVEGDGSTG